MIAWIIWRWRWHRAEARTRRAVASGIPLAVVVSHWDTTRVWSNRPHK